jgi:hypothetical protein
MKGDERIILKRFSERAVSEEVWDKAETELGFLAIDL